MFYLVFPIFSSYPRILDVAYLPTISHKGDLGVESTLLTALLSVLPWRCQE